MTEENETDRLLAPFFAAGLNDGTPLPEGLAARVVADAARVQADWQEAAWRPASVAKDPIWRQVLSLLGGAPALGGLVAACATGLWLGAAPPQGMDPLAYVVGDASVLSVYSSIQDTILSEEDL